MYYIHETEFNTLELVRRPKWFHDGGVPVSDEYLADENYFKVDENFPEDVDTRFQSIKENPKSEWIKDDIIYKKTYTVEDIPVDELVENFRRILNQKINQIRFYKLRTGVEYVLEGNSERIQCGPNDITALSSTRIIAQDLVNSGNSSFVMKIRTLSNKVYSVTAQEMIDLTNAAFAYGEYVYEQSWDIKDQVNETLDKVKDGTLEKVEGITQAEKLVEGV